MPKPALPKKPAKPTGPAALADLKPNPKNPRTISEGQLLRLRQALEEFGPLDGFVFNRRSGRLVSGHQRAKVLPAEALIVRERSYSKATKNGTVAEGKVEIAGERFGYREVDWTEKKEVAAMLAANQHGGDWAEDQLADLLRGMNGVDRLISGFDSLAIEELGLDLDGLPKPQLTPQEAVLTLAQRFGVPPFTVLDARQGYWRERKRAWLALGIQSEIGRGQQTRTSARAKPGEDPTYREIRGGAAPGGSPRPAADYSKKQRGDGAGRPLAPQLNRAQLVARLKSGDLKWQELSRSMGGMPDNVEAAIPDFYRKKRNGQTLEEIIADFMIAKQSEVAGHNGASIFDPVLCELAYRWFCPPGGTVLDPFAGGSVRGIVAARLGRGYVGIDLSEEQLEANREQAKRIVPDRLPDWKAGDSRAVGKLAPGSYDLVFSCPPYFDLEVYSSDKRDLSTAATFEDFQAALKAIVSASCAMLKPDRFAVFVVGDVRDKQGNYRNFPARTIEAFLEAGLKLYNEAVLVTSVGSLPIRLAKQFMGSRKFGKTHQNVLVFVKGSATKAAQAIGEVEAGESLEGEQTEFGERITSATLAGEVA